MRMLARGGGIGRVLAVAGERNGWTATGRTGRRFTDRPLGAALADRPPATFGP
ncbi:MAG: hypothetical protein ACK52I_06195 [Pseudomonadota bacterium]